MLVLGLMSGTSVDGIDVAIAELDGTIIAPGTAAAQHDRERLTLRQIAFATVPWADRLRAEIFALFDQPTTAAAICRANFRVGEQFAQAALTVLAHAGVAQHEIDLIGSHGQTIWHDVEQTAGQGEQSRGQTSRVTSTLQIGEPAVIAARTGVTTVGNFRVADVAAGGQGAPLVSTFDWHLLRPPPNLNGIPGGWRAVQNIGGIANVTFLPPVDVASEPVAFDTGPGNALIDWAAGQASQGQLRYDRDGQLAATGTVSAELLKRWLADPYFQQPPPKTTGRERFGIPQAMAWQAEAHSQGLAAPDLVATLTELTAASIADAYARFAPGPLAQVVVGGGGAANPVLLARLSAQLSMQLGRTVEVCSHAALGIDADAKEALAFALLAYLAIHGHAGNVPACTGAAQAQILGQIAPGENYGRLMRRVWQGDAGALRRTATR